MIGKKPAEKLGNSSFKQQALDTWKDLRMFSTVLPKCHEALIQARTFGRPSRYRDARLTLSSIRDAVMQKFMEKQKK